MEFTPEQIGNFSTLERLVYEMLQRQSTNGNSGSSSGAIDVTGISELITSASFINSDTNLLVSFLEIIKNQLLVNAVDNAGDPIFKSPFSIYDGSNSIEKSVFHEILNTHIFVKETSTMEIGSAGTTFNFAANIYSRIMIMPTGKASADFLLFHGQNETGLPCCLDFGNMELFNSNQNSNPAFSLEVGTGSKIIVIRTTKNPQYTVSSDILFYGPQS